MISELRASDRMSINRCGNVFSDASAEAILLPFGHFLCSILSLQLLPMDAAVVLAVLLTVAAVVVVVAAAATQWY